MYQTKKSGFSFSRPEFQSPKADAIDRITGDQLPNSNTGYFTVKHFAAANPAFTEPAMRNLIFKASPRMSSKGEISGNGLIECGAIVRIGRKVLINAAKFFEWVEVQQHIERGGK